MNVRQARVAILESFKAHWDVNGLGVQVVYDNNDIYPEGTEWLQFTVQHTAGTIASLGQKQFRRSGLIVGNIYVSEGIGQQRVDAISEAFLAWIETFAIGDIRVRDPGLIEIGAVNGWWQANVIATFEYDAFRT